MAPRATLVPETCAGLDCWRLGLPGGDSLRVAEQGGHVLSWIAGGRERLFLSPRGALDASAPIRGGVPVCWPQFNQRGNGPKHGFARQLPWLTTAYELGPDAASLELTLCSSERTRALWPHEFELTLMLQLRPGRLRLTLGARNTGAQALAFTGALHSYFACDDVAQAELSGLRDRPEWDALTDGQARAVESLRFDAEFDRVYSGTAAPMLLREGAQGLRISQSDSWSDTVVWNPHVAKCAALADMEADGWRRMLCVEAARVFEPVPLAPGQQWQGWQQLELG
ncbi:MAG: putative glucose-6-phosphate 1-epimerase [Pseudomonadota bacterium]